MGAGGGLNSDFDWAKNSGAQKMKSHCTCDSTVFKNTQLKKQIDLVVSHGRAYLNINQSITYCHRGTACRDRCRAHLRHRWCWGIRCRTRARPRRHCPSSSRRWRRRLPLFAPINFDHKTKLVVYGTLFMGLKINNSTKPGQCFCRYPRHQCPRDSCRSCARRRARCCRRSCACRTWRPSPRSWPLWRVLPELGIRRARKKWI